MSPLRPRLPRRSDLRTAETKRFVCGPCFSGLPRGSVGYARQGMTTPSGGLFTRSDAKLMLALQDGLCRMCHVPLVLGGRDIRGEGPPYVAQVDHAHLVNFALYGVGVGPVRSILCSRCNWKLVGRLEYEDGPVPVSLSIDLDDGSVLGYSPQLIPADYVEMFRALYESWLGVVGGQRLQSLGDLDLIHLLESGGVADWLLRMCRCALKGFPCGSFPDFSGGLTEDERSLMVPLI